MTTIEETKDQASKPRSLPDPICMAVGSRFYVANHRFGDLYFESPLGRSPRLGVSRYYWELDPPVAVDMIGDLRYGETELATKKQYLSERGILYLLVKDAWDGEGAEAELFKQQSPEQAKQAEARGASQPLVGPRHRR